MTRVIGIDLGTTNAALATASDDEPARALPIAQVVGPGEIAERETEADKILDACVQAGIAGAALDQRPHRVDDDGGIAQPMEEIIGIGIVGGDDGRGEHRSPGGSDRLPEARPFLDEMNRRDALQHRRRRQAILPIHPLGERGAGGV